MAEPLAALGTDPNALAYRSALLPLGRTNAGNVTWAVPQAVLSALGAAQLPGQVYRGEASIYDPATGHVSDEAVGRAFDLAGTAMTGSLPFSKPAGAIGMFGGRNAKTADLEALRLAEILETKFGASREKIWEDTGWFKGADQKWRFEIPDDLSTLGPARNAPAGYSSFHHDDLAQAYPSLWQGTQQSIREGAVAKGRYEAQDGVIHAQGPTEAAQRSVALHEYQHPIQRSEGFAVGDNPQNYGPAAWEAAGRPMLSESPDAASAHAAWARDQYHRSAGEVEARNVQRRADMTPDQRFSTPPWLTQDVPDVQQIVRFGLGGPQMSLGGAAADAGPMRALGTVARHDPLADLEFALTKGIAENPQAPPAGPRRLDPNAASWDLYHGSTAGPDFRRFDPQASSNPAERGAVFFAPNPETASGYASATAQGGEAGNRVFRTTVEPGRTKVFDLADLAETDPAFTARAREITAGQGGASHGALFDEYMTGFRASRAQDREIAGQLREMGYAPGDPSPISYGYGHIGAAVERAKAEGLDTAILRGLAEHGGDDQVIALTPGRVRSHYDPSQVLFSRVPVGLGLGGLGAAAFMSSDAVQAAPQTPLSRLGR